jgi:hypothetical protein
MKFGTVEDHHDPTMVCMCSKKSDLRLTPEAGKHLVAKTCTLQKISQKKSYMAYTTMGICIKYFWISPVLGFLWPFFILKPPIVC